MADDLEAAPKIAGAIVVCDDPDYCRSPKKVVPYQIAAKHAEAVGESPNVNFKGTPAMTMASRIPAVHGDEAGSKGIKSGTVKGEARPIANPSSTVHANGKQVLRHDTKWTMNCANTTGKTRWQKTAAKKGWKALVDFDRDPCAPEWFNNTADALNGTVSGVAEGFILDPAKSVWDLVVATYEQGIGEVAQSIWDGLSWDIAYEFFDINNIADELSEFIVKGDWWSGGQGFGRGLASLFPLAGILKAGGGAARSTAKGASRMRGLAGKTEALPKLSQRFDDQAKALEEAASRLFDQKNAAQAKELGDSVKQMLPPDTTGAVDKANQENQKKKKKKSKKKGGGAAGKDGVLITK